MSRSRPLRAHSFKLVHRPGLTVSLRSPDRGHTIAPHTRSVRRLALGLMVLALAVPVGVLAAAKPPAGALSIEGGRGVIVVRGSGGLLGRVAHGSVEVV